MNSDPPPVDWFDTSRTRPAHFLAEKTCEMICYLWFSTSSPEHSYPSPNNSPSYLHRPNSSTSTLQLVATPTFVQFMQKLLETTQVSQSVIVLSLHYIYKLKERNRFTPAQPGSEFRIAVAGLMMANKFLDEWVRTYFDPSPQNLNFFFGFQVTLTPIRPGQKFRVSSCWRLTGWRRSFYWGWTLIYMWTSRRMSRG